MFGREKNSTSLQRFRRGRRIKNVSSTLTSILSLRERRTRQRQVRVPRSGSPQQAAAAFGRKKTPRPAFKDFGAAGRVKRLKLLYSKSLPPTTVEGRLSNTHR